MSDLPQKVSLLDRQRAIWRQNHIGIVLGFTVLILVVGASVLAYRQSRFQPPRFPSGLSMHTAGRIQMIDSVKGPIPESEALTVTVSGAVNETGEIFLAIYADESSFNDTSKAISRVRELITNGESRFTFRAKDLPARIAITAFHDENSDGELNRNQIGIPMERYGFSNDARGTFGPPTFEESVIERPEKGNIQIFIR
jgi:uncharacterized protein (DUF2141 family)